MRISTAQITQQGINTMLDRQAELSKTQLQLGSGTRILQPSDDVVGINQVLALDKVTDTHKRYVANSDSAEYRLQLEENALTQGVNVLQRIRELAVQSTNPTFGASELGKIAPEVRELLGEMLGLANSTDADGEYIFAGYNVDTTPFVATENPVGSGLYDYSYTGDSGQRNVQISTSRQIAVGDPGDAVFMNVPNSTGTQNIFETLEQFALDMENNTPSATIVSDLDAALEHFATSLSSIGGRLNAITSQREFNEDVILQSEAARSKVKDLDYTEAVSRFNQQTIAMEAAQQSFARIQGLNLFSYL